MEVNKTTRAKPEKVSTSSEIEELLALTRRQKNTIKLYKKQDKILLDSYGAIDKAFSSTDDILEKNIKRYSKIVERFEVNEKLLKNNSTRRLSEEAIEQIKKDLGLMKDKDGRPTGLLQAAKKRVNITGDAFGKRADAFATAHTVAKTTKDVSVVAGATTTVVMTGGSGAPLVATMLYGTGAGTTIGLLNNVTQEAAEKLNGQKKTWKGSLKNIAINTGKDTYTAAKTSALTVTGTKIASAIQSPFKAIIASGGTIGVLSAQADVAERIVIEGTGSYSFGGHAKKTVISGSFGVIGGSAGAKFSGNTFSSQFADKTSDVGLALLQTMAEGQELNRDNIINNVINTMASSSANNAARRNRVLIIKKQNAQNTWESTVKSDSSSQTLQQRDKDLFLSRATSNATRKPDVENNGKTKSSETRKQKTDDSGSTLLKYHGDDQVIYDLRGEDLSFRDLRYLSQKDFTNAVLILEGANLQGSNLSGFHFPPGTRLMGANLQGANLHGSILHHANLSGADLRNANLSGPAHENLYNINLKGADLRGANLRDAGLQFANLQGAKLQGADLSHANLNGSTAKGANFTGAKLEGSFAAKVDFTGAKLDQANLKNADLRGSNLNLKGSKGVNTKGILLTQVEANMYKTGKDTTDIDLNMNNYLQSKTPIIDIVGDAFKKNRGLVIGEDHTHLKHKRILAKRMGQLKQQGLKAIGMEMVEIKDQKLLDDYMFAQPGTKDATRAHFKLYTYLDHRWGGHNSSNAKAYMAIIEAAKQNGVYVVAMDNPSAACNKILADPYSPDPRHRDPSKNLNIAASNQLRFAESNPQMAGALKGHMDANHANDPNAKFLALTGAHHAGSKILENSGRTPSVSSFLGVPSITIVESGQRTPIQVFNKSQFAGQSIMNTGPIKDYGTDYVAAVGQGRFGRVSKPKRRAVAANTRSPKKE